MKAAVLCFVHISEQARKAYTSQVGNIQKVELNGIYAQCLLLFLVTDFGKCDTTAQAATIVPTAILSLYIHIYIYIYTYIYIYIYIYRHAKENRDEDKVNV